MKKIMVVFALVSAVLLQGNSAQAAYSLAFDSLPDTQGWVGSASFDLDDVFSVGGGYLWGDSMDTPTTSGGYLLHDIINPDSAWQLSWTVQLTDYWGPYYHAAQGHGGLTVLAHINGFDVGIQYGLEYIGYTEAGRSVHLLDGSTSGGQYIPLETFVSHHYRIDYTPDLDDGPGNWNFYLDSALISSGTGQPQSRGDDNFLLIGDGAGGANAAWMMSEFTFNQASEVPVPGAIWLLGSGLIGLTGLIRSKGRA